jgi:superfamily II DNA or RNA helicase
MSEIRRYSSRRHRLDQSFLVPRLRAARAYDRIAGYFCSSIIEAAGEELEAVSGQVRMICNSDLDPLDVASARAARDAIRRSWCAWTPERLLEGATAGIARKRFHRLYELLRSGKLVVRVLPNQAFGLEHGKAGLIQLADGSWTSFIGSANESFSAWRMNYELVWEDDSPEAVAWVREEFEALWRHPLAHPLAEAVIIDIDRLASREVIPTVTEWAHRGEPGTIPEPAPVVIETPVYRRDSGLWEHQKFFVKTVIDAHHGPTGKARFVLADEVGLGKTIELALAAMLIGLTGDRPILVLCPKTLVWQWQSEISELLDAPSAVWDGQRWWDENHVAHPGLRSQGIKRCPRRIGIVSSGLVTAGSEAAEMLASMRYDCVILDEAHRARRRNLGEGRDGEQADPNNLLRFMYRITQRTRSLLLATATPVQMRPVEAWDLLDVLSRGDDAVLGNQFSRWRRADEALRLVMHPETAPTNEVEQWEWITNPMPPAGEGTDFELLRRAIGLDERQSAVAGDRLTRLGEPQRQRLRNLFPRFVTEHNPFIRRIIRRTRDQLERQFDPETGEPLLRPIAVELLGESDEEAIAMPGYLQDAYAHAEDFCHMLAGRLKSAGFLKTLLLRRVGSSIEAGRLTAKRMLESWGVLDEEFSGEDDPEEAEGLGDAQADVVVSSKALTDDERAELEAFTAALDAYPGDDPKYQVVLECLRNREWLAAGCIVFSQYRDSIKWLAGKLGREFPSEPIAMYSGSDTSGIQLGVQWTSKSREHLKEMVRRGEIRLLLGTDSASEGLNLQRLARLINLDLPWNPTRLEQRKGRIQRIGQAADTVYIYNLRYRGSVEDQVHRMLSSRLQNIYTLFGQVPDVLEDAWILVAQGEREAAERLIDALPRQHPFEIRYSSAVQKTDWESCRQVLQRDEKRRVLSQGW